jgi:hypothetical protein
MGLIRMIIDFILGLLGQKKADALPAAPSFTGTSSAVPDESEEEEREAPPDFGPHDPNDVEGFMWNKLRIERAWEDEAKLQQLLRECGYRSREHYQRIEESFRAKFSRLPGRNGSYDLYTETQLTVSPRIHQEMMQSAMSADPNLLAPVEGVSVETYAAIAARQAMGLAGPEFLQLLAQSGMDAGKWERVSSTWNDRMSKDTSFTITQIYGKAFAGAGQGAYGAAAQAGAQAMHGATGAVSQKVGGGQEPVSLDRYAEIMGAQSAWAKQGLDVNAMLKQVFGMTALDYSNIGTYWSMRFATEYDAAMRHSDLMLKYEQQYLAQGGGKADSDLSF